MAYCNLGWIYEAKYNGTSVAIIQIDPQTFNINDYHYQKLI